MEKAKSTLSGDIIGILALNALQLSGSQRAAALMALYAQRMGRPHTNLKTCTVRIFGTYKESYSLQKPGKLSMANGEYDRLGIANPDTYLASKMKRSTGQNRHGMEKLAIAKTGSKMNLGNNILLGVENGIVCYRCGASDHTLRNCPIPFHQKLAFAPTRNPVSGEGKGAK